jgi:hypothetical protein
MKAYSIFNATGKIQEIKPVPTLPIGCKIFAYGYGMEATPGAIISEADQFGTYKGVYISDYKRGFFTIDKNTRPHSEKFGIGHYFDDNLEVVEDYILEQYIIKAEIDKNIRKQQADDKAIADRNEKEELPLLHPHLLVNPTDDQNTTKKNIVLELKKNFPNFKFSVRKDYYDSYTVAWADGPTEGEVDNVVSKFVDHENDFTGDFRDPNPSNFNKVFGGFKYVSTSRSFSEKVSALLDSFKILDKTKDNDFSWEVETNFYRILRKTSFASNVEFLEIKKIEGFSGSYEDSFEFICKESASSTGISQEKNNLNLVLVDYSEKAIALFGETKEIKDSLKEIGGRFNKFLTHNGDKKAGWIFSKTKTSELESLISGGF